MRLPEVRETEPLEKKFPRISSAVLDLQKVCTSKINVAQLFHSTDVSKVSGYFSADVTDYQLRQCTTFKTNVNVFMPRDVIYDYCYICIICY